MATPDYGTGISVLGDIRRNMGSVSGKERVAQAAILRLTGNWFYDADYGFNLVDAINSDADDAWQIAPRVEQELLKDDRIEECTADVTFEDGTLVLTINCMLSNAESFTLVGRTIGEIPTADMTFSVESNS